MKYALDKSTVWIARHSILIWIGIALNLLLIIPLFFFPERMLAFLNLPPLTQTIWARASGMLLAIISVFYVPTTFDFARFRPYAWLAVFPSRTFGTTFFALAVFVFNQAPAFLIVSLIDGFVGLTTLICLIKIRQHEQLEASGGD